MSKSKTLSQKVLFLMITMLVFIGAWSLQSAAAKGTNMLGNCEPYFIKNASLEDFTMGGIEYEDGYKCRVASDRHTEIGFNLGNNYTSVSFDVGHIDGTAANSSEIKLTILGDGEELKVLELTNEGIPQSVVLNNLSGISQLTFKWSCRYYDSYFGIAALNFTGKGWSAVQKNKDSNMLYNCEPYNKPNASVQDFSMGQISYKDGLKFRIAFDKTARADFNFGGNYESITFDVGHIDGTSDGASDIVLNILVGTETYMSLPLNDEDIPKTVTIPLTNVHQFSFVWSSRYYDSYFGISGIQLKSNGIVRDIKLEESSLDLTYTNPTSYVKAHVVPSDANNTNVTWTSSDTSIATVNNQGLVTAIGNGTAIITATTQSGAKTALCTVNVTGMPVHMTKTSISVASGHVYSGSAITPKITVTYDGKTLKKGTDYVVTYAKNINAGTATATFTGVGAYNGTVTKNFVIQKADQEMTSKVSKKTLVVGKSTKIKASGQGTITYTSSNTAIATVSSTGKIKAVSPGTVKITVKADGGTNYDADSKTFTIKVNPKSTKITYAKNTDKKQVTVRWKKVSGVTGYEVRYVTGSSKKVTTVKKASTTSKKIKKLKVGKTYRIYVRTYKKVAGKKYYSAWSKAKKVRITR